MNFSPLYHSAVWSPFLFSVLGLGCQGRAVQVPIGAFVLVAPTTGQQCQAQASEASAHPEALCDHHKPQREKASHPGMAGSRIQQGIAGITQLVLVDVEVVVVEVLVLVSLLGQPATVTHMPAAKANVKA
jgi:hypothetical protein